MTLKKLFSILLVICMVVSFAACGNKNNDDEDDDSGSKTTSRDKGGLLSKDKGNDDDDDNGSSSSNDDDDDDDNGGSNSSNGDDDDNGGSNSGNDDDDKNDPLAGLSAVDLPKEYPDDKYPIIQGGIVTYATLDNSDGFNRFVVIINCAKNVEDVSTFYNTVLASAEDKADSKGDGIFNSSGKFGGYSYNLTIMGENKDSEACMVSLDLKEIPSLDAVLNTVEVVEMPENYPFDKFPFVDDAKIYEASESESSGLVSYSISVYTGKSFKDVVAFYESELGTIEEKSKEVSSDDFTLSGIAKGYHFYIFGYMTTLNGIEITQYNLQLDPVTE